MSKKELPPGLHLPQENDPSSSKQDYNHQNVGTLPNHKENTLNVGQDINENPDFVPFGRLKGPLTEEQRKANHISSEQKRREKIREQYDKLAGLTPGMEGQGRSEGRVLEQAVKHAVRLKEERATLIQNIEAKGGIVPPDLKDY